MSRDAAVRSRSSTPCFLLVGSEGRLEPALQTLTENFDDPTLLTHPSVDPGSDWSDVAFDVDCIVVDAESSGTRPGAAIETLSSEFDDTLLYAVLDEEGPLTVEEALSYGATDVAWHDVTGYEVFASRLRGAIEEDATHRFNSATRQAAEHVAAGSVGDVLNGGTPLEVSRRLVETATDLLGDATVELYLHDQRTETLQLTAFSSGPRTGKPPSSYALGEGSAVARAYLTEETLIRDPDDGFTDEDGDGRSVVVPACGIGVLVATEQGFDVRTIETARLVASLGELAFGWHTNPPSAESTQPAERLGHADGLTDLADRVRSIEHELVRTESREAVEQNLCERLNGFDDVTLAWVGETETRTDTIAPRSWAGDSEYIETVSIDGVDEDTATGTPAARTAASGTVTEIAGLDEGAADADAAWRTAARECGHGSVLSVPLTFDGMTYGVVTVFGSDADTFDGVVGTLVRELATTAAYAIDAMVGRERPLTDHRLRLDCLSRSATTLLPRLVRELPPALELESLFATQQGARAFFDVPDEHVDAFERILADDPDVASFSWIGGQAGVCHLVVEDPILATVAAADGSVHRLEDRDDAVQFTVEVPAGTDVDDLLSSLDVGGDDVELLTRRRTADSVRTAEGARSDVERRLSDRELGLLRLAHEAGYFDWPRETSSADLADLAGGSQSTVSKQIRAGQATVMDVLFDG
ncbi:GAF domain-containing protein [Haloarchaeobius sp. TZWSO28]|uniref:GAF domain-containing protein n=1 Tax=Haloarchaeobius sp. TZWSO28 TaxID=3446119 RepID=UPI003EC01C66